MLVFPVVIYHSESPTIRKTELTDLGLVMDEIATNTMDCEKNEQIRNENHNPTKSIGKEATCQYSCSNMRTGNSLEKSIMLGMDGRRRNGCRPRARWLDASRCITECARNDLCGSARD